MYLSLSLFLSPSFLSSAICKASSDNQFAFLPFFFFFFTFLLVFIFGIALFTAFYTVLWTSAHSSLGPQFSSVQSLSSVWLFATPLIAARQASLSMTNSQSSLRLMSIESVMPSSHLILCRPLLLLHPIPPSIRVFSNESTLRMRRLKYRTFSFSIFPFKEIQGWSPSEWTGWISLQSKGLSRVFSNTTVQKH